MPYDRPTITELMDGQVVEFSSRLNIPKEQVRRSNVGVSAKVQAGGLHGLHGHLQHVIDQNFADSAEIDFLLRHGEPRDIFRKEATKASGSREIRGNDGAAVSAGEILQRADGLQFEVITGATIVAGVAVVQVEAVEVGASANTALEEPLPFITPIAGVESVSLTGELTGGADIESIESYRARVLAYMREPPHGGNDSDYEQWVKSVPGVNVHRVWVFRKWMGRGTVGVFFTVNGGEIPDVATVALVQNWVVDRVGAPAPVVGDIFIIAPTAVPVPLVVSGLNPDTPQVREAAELELADLFARSTNVEGGNGEAKLLLSHLREAISIASGERDHVIDSPATNITLERGQLPVFGGVAWT